MCSSGEMYPEKLLLSWYQTKEFNIWNIDFQPLTDAYLVEVSPRDYPDDVITNRDNYEKPNDFPYSYTDIYGNEIHEIENPRKYWEYLNNDNSGFFYVEGAEMWPLFSSAVERGDIINVPKSILEELQPDERRR